MAKRESNLINMALTLFVITAVSSTALGFMYQLTKEPKAAAELAKQNFAIKAVSVTDFDNNPSADTFTIESYDGGETLECYPATKNGELQSIAVKTWTLNGFSGLVRLMAGFDKAGNIIGISVLEQKETPGLGSKMTNAEFKDQFNGKNPGTGILSVRKDGGEVDAITAATISSRAFTDAVNRAYQSLVMAGKISMTN
ncbi:MAG: RnfABCDGE type electron transport complex subunit G [Bacteroidales bacterium]|jgi:electron transport complex protein RnfG|nr:RnfABCDGE type electron transport complex subunit G [Bacteroidales bacterium]